jgi:hypothetical protein
MGVLDHQGIQYPPSLDHAATRPKKTNSERNRANGFMIMERSMPRKPENTKVIEMNE